MSTVHRLIPRLTINGVFIDAFLRAPAPCFALGLIEERRRSCGFLAIRPEDIVPSEVTRSGFRFGHSLLGTSQYAVVHFVFKFSGYGRYHALVNPNNPIVCAVLTRMVESGTYFFMAINPNGSATVFNADVGQGSGSNLAGLKSNLPRILQEETTEAEYQQAFSRFQIDPQPPGKMLHWVCRDDTACLDLTSDRLEMSPVPE